jgi:hypothetical protein
MLAVGEDRRQARGECELNKAPTVRQEQPVGRHDDGVGLPLGEIVEGRSEIVGHACITRSERAGRS